MPPVSFSMTVETKKLLLDVREAGDSILQHTVGKSLDEYSGDRFFRRAVEREFEIIGEALRRLESLDSATAARITDLRLIIDFRNRIIHGYDTVDDMVVWGIVGKRLPILTEEAAGLLDAGGVAG